MSDQEKLDALRVELDYVRSQIKMGLPRSHTDNRLVWREFDLAKKVYALERKLRDASI